MNGFGLLDAARGPAIKMKSEGRGNPPIVYLKYGDNFSPTVRDLSDNLYLGKAIDNEAVLRLAEKNGLYDSVNNELTEKGREFLNYIQESQEQQILDYKRHFGLDGDNLTMMIQNPSDNGKSLREELSGYNPDCDVVAVFNSITKAVDDGFYIGSIGYLSSIMMELWSCDFEEAKDRSFYATRELMQMDLIERRENQYTGRFEYCPKDKTVDAVRTDRMDIGSDEIREDPPVTKEETSPVKIRAEPLSVIDQITIDDEYEKELQKIEKDFGLVYKNQSGKNQNLLMYEEGHFGDYGGAVYLRTRDTITCIGYEKDGTLHFSPEIFYLLVVSKLDEKLSMNRFSSLFKDILKDEPEYQESTSSISSEIHSRKYHNIDDLVSGKMMIKPSGEDVLDFMYRLSKNELWLPYISSDGTASYDKKIYVPRVPNISVSDKTIYSEESSRKLDNPKKKRRHSPPIPEKHRKSEKWHGRSLDKYKPWSRY